MGQGMDICLGDPALAATLEDSLESEFASCLVRNAGSVLLGVKPAAIFSFTPRSHLASRDSSHTRCLADRLVAVYASLVCDLGLRIVWLARRGAGLMLLVWRPAQVERILDREEVRELLRELSLPETDPPTLVSTIVARLRACYATRGPFPHEVGIVLGYPVEDVRGFIADGGAGAKVSGRWKVYGDVSEAKRQFEELSRAEARCKRLYSEGTSVGELLRMGAA